MVDDSGGDLILGLLPIWLVGIPAGYLTFVINWFYPIFEDVFAMSLIVGGICSAIVGFVMAGNIYE